MHSLMLLLSFKHLICIVLCLSAFGWLCVCVWVVCVCQTAPNVDSHCHGNMLQTPLQLLLALLLQRPDKHWVLHFIYAPLTTHQHPLDSPASPTCPLLLIIHLFQFLHFCVVQIAQNLLKCLQSAQWKWIIMCTSFPPCCFLLSPLVVWYA